MSWILLRQRTTGISNAGSILNGAAVGISAMPLQRVYEENYSVYGVRKVWRQLKREGVGVARCTIEHLMKVLQIRGVTRGKSVRTPVAAKPIHHWTG